MVLSYKKVFKMNCSKNTAFPTVAGFPDKQIDIKWKNTQYLGSVFIRL